MSPLSSLSVADIALESGWALALVVTHPCTAKPGQRDGRNAIQQLLRSVLGHVLGASPAALCLEKTSRGKPYLAGNDGISFNLSHSCSHSLIALSLGANIGCDIEDRFRDGDDVDELGAVVLHSVEQQELERLPESQRQEAFRRYWVRKEAVLKASGSGFLKDPRAVIVGLDRAQPTWDGVDGPAMKIHEKQLGAGCFAAVASVDAGCSWHALAP